MRVSPVIALGLGLLCAAACTRPAAGPGAPCSKSIDCLSLLCTGGKCAEIGCDDKTRNGDETDVDCGGSCPKCLEGKSCVEARDCTSGVCTAGLCNAPSCIDGRTNAAETDVDCGGASCPPCGVGQRCTAATDCLSLSCVADGGEGRCAGASCTDGRKNGAETDVDCGGGSCGGCADGKSCAGPLDCRSHLCTSGVCVPATCSDGLLNGSESDVDCGGLCPPCPGDKVCRVEPDCAFNRTCTGFVCSGCRTGFSDCDLDGGNGCEVNLAGDPRSCGACNAGCSNNHATPACTAGACTSACAPLWADCNSDLRADGCELDVSSDVNHCGGCTTVCNSAHATVSCDAGQCVLGACAAGWGHCELDAGAGCETDLTQPTSCGACGNDCTRSMPHAVTTCGAGGACQLASCQSGFYDLNGIASDGCEYACTFTGAADLPDSTFTDSNCDGVDGDASAALFVSTLGLDTNPGTRAQPMATIIAAVARASSTGKTQVLVAAGTYSGRVILAEGVGVYGGYSDTDWSRSASAVTTIESLAEAGGRVSAVEGTNLSAATVLDRLTIHAGSASSSGASAYAVACTTCSGLSVLNSVLEAGNGASGSPGTNGAAGANAGNGQPGTGGSCDRNDPGGPGGPGGTSGCGRTGGAGGRGGNYGSNPGVMGGTGVVGMLGGSPGAGGDPGRAGGPGTNAAPWPGAAGSDGASGSGGTVVAGFWLSSAGGIGLGGSHGNGGGGGGGGGGQGGTFVDDGNGNGGGGGGGGGCGGQGATGGTGGGGSFGLFLVSSNGVTVRNTTIRTGAGGSGGAGGAGGGGGTGGSGGSGAVVCTGEVGAGGNGGDGGAGGRGGHGGGGAGGESWAIYRVASTVSVGGSTLQPGSGGSGGSSLGNPGVGGASGQMF